MILPELISSNLEIIAALLGFKLGLGSAKLEDKQTEPLSQLEEWFCVVGLGTINHIEFMCVRILFMVRLMTLTSVSECEIIVAEMGVGNRSNLKRCFLLRYTSQH